MKPRHLLLIASIAAFILSAVSAGGAFANDRYATPPALTISPQQAAPWIAQLQQPQPVIVPVDPNMRRQKPQNSVKRAARTNAAYQRNANIRTQAAPQSKTRRQTGKMNPIYLPQEVDYASAHKAGTIVIDTKSKFLYLVGQNGKARRYGVGVGKTGFSWKGTETVSRKAKWPTWHPPKTMIERERKKGRILPARMEGGIANPLGARALYLGNTLYRIHGTNAPSTIGRAVSSGCIRMRNQDVKDLYERVPVGTKVVVL